ncbi:hypothetical protein LCGC14_0846610 [marine sediment metagenome]|uniref:Uncharacterized protein n=1 Tax=marine sediment metagenome TaxID=412755 RepID=A0A0F9SIM0_9ZZZZ
MRYKQNYRDCRKYNKKTGECKFDKKYCGLVPKGKRFCLDYRRRQKLER